jgi:hypothetical protein
LFVPSDIATVANYARDISAENITFCILGAIFCTPVVRNAAIHLKLYTSGATAQYTKLSLTIQTLVCLAMFGLCTVYVLSGTYNPFIYFRF